MNRNLKTEFDQNLEKLIINYNSYFLNICKVINLNEKWDKEISLELEIKKSFIRGLLRYSNFSNEIIKITKRKFRACFPNSNHIKWITLPYPMIHLSNDQVEFGSYHIDRHNNENLFTCWLPISNYNYPALSIFFEMNSFLIKFFSNKFPQIFNKFSSKIFVKQGNIFFWNGNLLHSGNLNTSNKISCAIQLKLSENPYDFEFCKNINDESNFLEFRDLDDTSIKNLFSNYSNGLMELNNNSKKENLFENSASFVARFDRICLPVSFGLSVLSQRLNSKKRLFNNNLNSKNFMESLDVASLILGSSNLISLKRLFEKNSKKNLYLQNLKTFDINKNIPFESNQFKKIIKNI